MVSDKFFPDYSNSLGRGPLYYKKGKIRSLNHLHTDLLSQCPITMAVLKMYLLPVCFSSWQSMVASQKFCYHINRIHCFPKPSGCAYNNREEKALSIPLEKFIGNPISKKTSSLVSTGSSTTTTTQFSSTITDTLRTISYARPCLEKQPPVPETKQVLH